MANNNVKLPPPVPAAPARPAPKGEPTMVAALTDQLNAYLKIMGPGQQLTQPTMLQAQLNLWRTISWVLKRPASEFLMLWGTLLKIVHENRKGAFSETAVYRGFPSLRLSGEDLKIYTRLLTLILRTCNPATRGHVASLINMRSILSIIPDQEAVQKLAEFYSV